MGIARLVSVPLFTGLFAIGLSIVAIASEGILDSDADGVPDAFDNCELTSNTDQCDTNFDGYGNACDADINDDGLVGNPDFNQLRADFNTTALDTDFNCDRVVGNPDFNIFRSAFGQPPGPSGLACAGTVPCGSGPGAQPGSPQVAAGPEAPKGRS